MPHSDLINYSRRCRHGRGYDKFCLACTWDTPTKREAIEKRQLARNPYHPFTFQEIKKSLEAVNRGEVEEVRMAQYTVKAEPKTTKEKEFSKMSVGEKASHVVSMGREKFEEAAQTHKKTTTKKKSYRRA